MYPGGMGFRPINEKCGGRPEGSHEIPDGGASATCIHCGALVYNNAPPIPTVTEVTPMPTEEAAPAPAGVKTDPWQGPVGLIDSLLDRRRMPDPSHLVAFLANEDFAKGYQAGIDAALDQLVPALKKIALLPPLTGMPGSYPRGEVDKVIGRVPLKRTVNGWE